MRGPAVPADQEADLARLAFMRGPAALLDAGYTAEAIQDFIARPAVRDLMAALASEYKNEEILFGRARFMAKRDMLPAIPDAVRVLRAAIVGPTYARDPQGGIVRDSRGRPVILNAIDDQQLVAANQLLDRVGVGDKKSVSSQDVNVNVLFTGASEARDMVAKSGENMTHEQRVISRERMRAVVEALAPHLMALRERIREVSHARKD
jgi:hypothetical protein